MKHTIIKNKGTVAFVTTPDTKSYRTDSVSEIDVQPGDKVEYKDKDGNVVLTVDIPTHTTHKILKNSASYVSVTSKDGTSVGYRTDDVSEIDVQPGDKVEYLASGHVILTVIVPDGEPHFDTDVVGLKHTIIKNRADEIVVKSGSAVKIYRTDQLNQEIDVMPGDILEYQDKKLTILVVNIPKAPATLPAKSQPARPPFERSQPVPPVPNPNPNYPYPEKSHTVRPIL